MSLINLNYYKFVMLDVHTLLFSILISTTGMIHLNKENHTFTSENRVLRNMSESKLKEAT